MNQPSTQAAHIKSANLGFATHLLTAGLSEAVVKSHVTKIAAVRGARVSRTRKIASTLLGGKDSRIFATA